MEAILCEQGLESCIHLQWEQKDVEVGHLSQEAAWHSG